jgi:arabinofuranosyltransferase
MFSFWDFATSGLETGLCAFWLAAIWWGLVGLQNASTWRRQLATALGFGLGPLVRPDFAIPAGVFLIAAWMIVRPRWRRTVGLAAVAGALPLAYELFRAGYYGTLVPLPALAKSATGTHWRRGLIYLLDFVHPAQLWLPIAILAAVTAVVIRRRALVGRDRIVVATPAVSGVLLTAFVVKLGGDFMHARMLLPAAFLLLMPSLVLPWRRLTAPAAIALAAWALVMGASRHATHNYSLPGQQINDERAGYIRHTATAHPVDAAPFIRAEQGVADMVFAAVRSGHPEIVTEGGERTPMRATLPASVVFVVGRLGTGGVIAPLDGIVGDTLGLANPIGARIPAVLEEGAGHEKLLPWAWLLADFGVTGDGIASSNISPPAVRAARHAMTCGRLAELLASVREPMSLGRFWDNLIGAIGRTTLVIPSSPFVAERTFCGQSLDPDLALGTTVAVSSSYEGSGWSAQSVADGVRSSTEVNRGFCSELYRMQPHEEWVTLTLPRPETFSKVVIHPSMDLGFPIDFVIQTWSNGAWVDQVKQVDYAKPATLVPQLFTLPAPVTSDRIRLDATKLRAVASYGYLLQLAEIELMP